MEAWRSLAGNRKYWGELTTAVSCQFVFSKEETFFSWYLNYVTKNELCYGLLSF